MNATQGGERPARPVESPSPLPPRPEFTPADIPGNLAEAMKLRCIGQGQPIKASWLCLENLDLYRRRGLPPDLALVETLQVLALCYTDDIKRGKVDVVGAADDAMNELAALSGVPQASFVVRRCMAGRTPGPAARLDGFRVRIPPAAAGDPAVLGQPARPGEPAPESPTARTPRMRFPVARIPRAAFPLSLDSDGCVEPARIAGATVLVPGPVQFQARFDALYLQGIVCMSQALRIERTGSATGAELGQQELPFLVEGAWWMHFAALAAPDAPADPAECHRRARAKSSMLIRRIQAGRHFEMATIGGAELLE
jgi:hypothetical protein